MARKLKIMAISIIIVLSILFPFLQETKVKAASYSARILTNYVTESNAVYPGYATKYVYSDGASVNESATVPQNVQWAVVSEYYDSGWSIIGSFRNPTYTYSINNQVFTTSNALAIPANARWATISGFTITSGSPAPPIKAQRFMYSIDGNQVLVAPSINDVPAYALWVTLSYFNDGWKFIKDMQFGTYEVLGKTVPTMGTPSFSADQQVDNWVKPGAQITLNFTTNTPVQAPSVMANGKAASITQGNNAQIWSAKYVPSTTDQEGTITFTGEFYSTDGSKGQFSYDTPYKLDRTAPAIQHTLNPSTPTNGNVVVQTSITDSGIGVKQSKFALGIQSLAYFSTAGTVFDSSFEATTNETYTIFAEDKLGNAITETVTISNIDRTAPVIQLSTNYTEGTNADITIVADILETESGLDKLKWASGTQDVSFFATGGTDFTANFSVNENGVYTVFAQDKAGNQAVQTITVSNIDKTAPVIQLSVSDTADTNADVTIVADVLETESGLDKLKWASGTQDTSFFTTGGTDFTANFSVNENGVYTVFAQDKAGNKAVQTIIITNIDKILPILNLVGDAEIQIEAGTNYIEAGATANDNKNGNLTSSIIISGDTVNTEVPNKYIVKYSVADSAGNVAEKTRMVIVRPKVVKLSENSNLRTIDVTEIFKGATLTLYDLHDKAINTKTVGDTIFTFNNVPIGKGYYVIQMVNGIDSIPSGKVDINPIYSPSPNPSSEMPPSPMETLKPPTVFEFSNLDTVLSGKAEPGAEIEIFINSKLFKTTKANNQGIFNLEIGKLKAGTVITVLAKMDGKEQSKAINLIVQDRTSPELTVSQISDKSKKITGKTTPFAKIQLIVKGKVMQTINADKTGKFEIPIKLEKAGTTIEIAVSDHFGNKKSMLMKVIDKTPPAKAKVNKVSTVTQKITGKAEKNAIVYLYNGKTKLASVKVTAKGTFTINIKKQKKGTKLTLYVEDLSGNKSKNTIITVK